MQHDPYQFEKRLWDEGFTRVMGLDEVGRGCIAGPVVAAGVVLGRSFYIPGIADSKTLSSAQRTVIAGKIKQNSIWWTVASCDVYEIASHNILRASLRAMGKCVEKTEPKPDFLLIDGNHGIPASLIPGKTIVKGDSLSASIGAASIIAKVFRDEYMSALHEQYPEFGWNKNAGYPTVHHYTALARYGYTPHHRTTFSLRTNKRYNDHQP